MRSRPVPKGVRGVRKNPPALPQRSAQPNEILFFYIFCVLFVSGPCCKHSVFTARMHKIAGFGSIFPKFSRGSMPRTPSRASWALPKHILVRLRTRRTHPSGLLRTAMRSGLSEARGKARRGDPHRKVAVSRSWGRAVVLCILRRDEGL